MLGMERMDRTEGIHTLLLVGCAQVGMVELEVLAEGAAEAELAAKAAKAELVELEAYEE